MEQIKESHGSVALTTFVQVEAINSRGIYYIAGKKRASESKHMNSGLGLCLENLVYLVVPREENKNREEKVYSLEEIKDVQSKLMLIAGKANSGKEEVDQFNQVCYINSTCTEHCYNVQLWLVRSTTLCRRKICNVAPICVFQYISNQQYAVTLKSV